MLSKKINTITLDKNLIRVFGIPVRKYKEARAARQIYVQRAAMEEIIQIDRGVNYQVNYTITHGGTGRGEVYDHHRIRASEKEKKKACGGRVERRSSATNSAD